MTNAQQPVDNHTSLSNMFTALAHDVGTLVRQEVTLAKTELQEKAAGASIDAAKIAVGGALSYAGLLVGVDGVTRLLAMIMPRWLAPLVVGAGLAGGGLPLMNQGRQALMQEHLLPEQTSASLQQGAALVNH